MPTFPFARFPTEGVPQSSTIAVGPNPFARAKRNPNTIPTPDYWWKADDIGSLFQDTTGTTAVTTTGQSVAHWKTNDAANDIRGSNAPVYTTGVLNSLAGIKFDGATDRINFNGSFPAAAMHDCTVFIVASGWTSAAVRHLWGSTTGANNTMQMYLNATHNAIMAEPGVGDFHTANAASSTSGAILVFQYDQITAETWDGTTSTGSTAATNGFVDDATYGIGRVGVQYFDGYLHEIMIYTPKLSTGQRSSVTTYLKNKWNL